MAVNGVNRQLSGMIDRYSFMRTGTVVLVDPFAVTVTVGETDMRAAYTRQSEPAIGDVVTIMRQGATWFVLGTTSSSGGNLVQNPSFETVNDDGTPTSWTLTNATNVMAVTVVTDAQAVDGDNVAQVFTTDPAAAVSRLYSAPFGVVVGTQLEISAYANGLYPAGAPNTADIQLQALWFANATDLYPTTSAADSTAQTITNIVQTDLMQVMRGTVTVPAGAVFARVGMRTAADPLLGASYDYVTARVV